MVWRLSELGVSTLIGWAEMGFVRLIGGLLLLLKNLLLS